MEIVVTRPGPVSFRVGGDDGYQLFLDGERLIRNWTTHSFQEESVTKDLVPGIYRLTLDYFESTGMASLLFETKPEVLGWREITSCEDGPVSVPAFRYSVYSSPASLAEVAESFDIDPARIVDAGVGFLAGRYLIPNPSGSPRKVIVVQGIDSQSSVQDLDPDAKPSFRSRADAILSAIRTGAWEADIQGESTAAQTPDIGADDVITFSYSERYYDPTQDLEITLDNHPGDGATYAIYEKEDTCQGVVPAADKLVRLIQRLQVLEPEVRIDIVAHSMGGLVSTYMLKTADFGVLSSIRSVTTLDSPLQGTIWGNPFSACLETDGSPKPAWQDLWRQTEVVADIATLEGSELASRVVSINSAIGSPLPGAEAAIVACALPLDLINGHSCIWGDKTALSIVSDTINLD